MLVLQVKITEKQDPKMNFKYFPMVFVVLVYYHCKGFKVTLGV